MKSESNRPKTGNTTIVLSVALILLVIGSLLFFNSYHDIHKFFVDHRSYKVYGGMTVELKDSEFYEDIGSGRSFCFLGDSITYGSVTDGIPWYQPLLPYINGDIKAVSHSGWAVKNLIEEIDNVPDADVYVIAIGINDILFPDDEDSAHTAEEFAARCNELGDLLNTRSPGSKIYFISPWSFVNYDISFAERSDQFRLALEETCKTNSWRYINPDPVIQSVIADEGATKYMFNDFHPNAPKGVGLFSYAVLKDAHDRNSKNN